MCTLFEKKDVGQLIDAVRAVKASIAVAKTASIANLSNL